MISLACKLPFVDNVTWKLQTKVVLRIITLQIFLKVNVEGTHRRLVSPCLTGSRLDHYDLCLSQCLSTILNDFIAKNVTNNS